MIILKQKKISYSWKPTTTGKFCFYNFEAVYGTTGWGVFLATWLDYYLYIFYSSVIIHYLFI